MAELREDSLLFSLEALRTRERERVALERAELERRQALASAARLDAERQRLELELRRERELEAARREEQRRLTEHAARLDTLRRTELERASKEAEARAESELTAQRLAHERRMTELTQQSQKTRDRALALLSCGLLALLVPSALWLYFGRILPQAEQLRTQLTELVAAERGRADEATRLLARTERARHELAGQVERLKLAQASAGQLPRETGARDAPRPGRGSGRGGSSLVEGNCVNDGDPLNPCLR